MKSCFRTAPGRRHAIGALLALPWLASGARAADSFYRAEPGWIDDGGRPFDLSRLKGGWTVATMAYGACRRICSTSLRLLQQLQALADGQHVPLNFVVMGLDPPQDKPADWAAFRADHRLQRGNWAFLSADAGATHRMADRLGIQYWRYGDHTMHDFRIVLMSPQGEVVRTMVAFDQPLSMLLPDA
jgi:cytochrome oxidase Cu insertion factor (SCO1/SenC/PrrC family)